MNQQYFEIARRIKRIHNTFAGSGSRFIRQQNLTFSQMEMMLYLMRNSGRPICQKELEEALHLTNPTVTGLLSRLEEKGMVVRRVDEKDRRFRRVELSQDGREVLKKVGDEIHRTERKLFGCLNREETDQLLELLDRVAQHAEAERECCPVREHWKENKEEQSC